MSTFLGWIEVIGGAAALFLVIRWSFGRWERREVTKYGPCMPDPSPKQVRASLRRRTVIYALEGWHKLRRDWPVPPADGERFSGPEIQALHDIWMSYDGGETAPEHYYPGITRDAEDL